MSLLEIWNNPMHPLEFRLEVAVSVIESLRQRVKELEERLTRVTNALNDERQYIERKLSDERLCHKETRERLNEVATDWQLTQAECRTLVRQNGEWQEKLAECERKLFDAECEREEAREKLAICEKELTFLRPMKVSYIEQQEKLAASQHYAQQLREALNYIIQYPEHPEVTARSALSKVGAGETAPCHECGWTNGYHDKRCSGFLVDPETGEPLPTHNA
jgi:chromosome segregation ATPase